MSCGPAPGPIIMAIGSPGATRSNMKTMTATPNSVTAAMPRRRRRIDRIIDALTFSRRAGEGEPSPASSLLRDEGRLHGARDVRRHLEIGLVDDRLHILQQRDHIALLGDVFVHGLPAGDALRLVLLAPEGADLGIEIIALPARMRRFAEHGEARRGGRVADGIAPIVEGEGGELMRGAQFEVLGYLIDLDLGLEADLAPHADDRLDHLVILRLEAARRLDRG